MRIKINFNKIPRGHTPHRSGAGKHGDKRVKRQKTRSNKERVIMKEWQ